LNRQISPQFIPNTFIPGYGQETRFFVGQTMPPTTQAPHIIPQLSSTHNMHYVNPAQQVQFTPAITNYVQPVQLPVINQRIVQHLIEDFKEKNDIDLNLPKYEKAKRRLFKEAETAKIQLSSLKEVSIDIDGLADGEISLLK